MLDTLGKTSNRLSALLKDRKALAGGEDLADFLNQALAEVVQEMGEGSKRTFRSLRQAQGTEPSTSSRPPDP